VAQHLSFFSAFGVQFANPPTSGKQAEEIYQTLLTNRKLGNIDKVYTVLHLQEEIHSVLYYIGGTSKRTKNQARLFIG
jgi:hypothetical protein